MESFEPKIELCDDHIGLSEKASKHIASIIKKKPDAVLCLPTGSTPTLTYQLLAKRYNDKEFSTDKLTIVKLDEWGGLQPDDPGTCEMYLQTNVILPLNIPKSRFISFRCDPMYPEMEVQNIEKALSTLPPFDIQLLGLGVNGHVGLNEPGEFIDKVHVTKLEESSLRHPMLHGVDTVNYGMTIGWRDILRAKEIVMLVSGKAKAEQLRRMVHDEISPAFPATNLRTSKNLRIIADRDAASLL